jgi:hypothetical protein
MGINEVGVQGIEVSNKPMRLKDIEAGLHVIEMDYGIGLVIKQGFVSGSKVPKDVSKSGLLVAWETGMYCTLTQNMLDGNSKHHANDHLVKRIGVIKEAAELFRKDSKLANNVNWIWHKSEEKPVLELTIEEIALKYEVDVCQIKIVEVK